MNLLAIIGTFHFLHSVIATLSCRYESVIYVVEFFYQHEYIIIQLWFPAMSFPTLKVNFDVVRYAEAEWTY